MINKSQDKPTRKYSRIVRKANLYDMFFMKKKAIDTIITALKQPLTDKEKSSAYIYIGLLYSDLKDYKRASENFHLGLTIVESQDFPYSFNFFKIINTFIKNDELERAKYWLENLTNRKIYDKNFSKLNHLYSNLK